MRSKAVDLRRNPEHKTPLWLVWAMHENGLTQMRAIASTPKRAQGYRKRLFGERGTVRAWIEIRDMDHLYGHNDVTEVTMTSRKELYKLADTLRASETESRKR